jgi:hypothetical protein
MPIADPRIRLKLWNQVLLAHKLRLRLS